MVAGFNVNRQINDELLATVSTTPIEMTGSLHYPELSQIDHGYKLHYKRKSMGWVNAFAPEVNIIITEHSEGTHFHIEMTPTRGLRIGLRILWLVGIALCIIYSVVELLNGSYEFGYVWLGMALFLCVGTLLSLLHYYGSSMKYKNVFKKNLIKMLEDRIQAES